jgi:hypothetical protein
MISSLARAIAILFGLSLGNGQSHTERAMTTMWLDPRESSILSSHDPGSKLF